MTLVSSPPEKARTTRRILSLIEGQNSMESGVGRPCHPRPRHSSAIQDWRTMPFGEFEWEVLMKEFLIGAAGIVLAGAAIAQAPSVQPVPQAAPVPPMAERIDTRDEMVAKVREHFGKLDANRDGFLTKEEAEAGRAQMKDHFRQRFADRGEHRMGQMEHRDP